MSQRALIRVLILFCLNAGLLSAQVPTIDPSKTVNTATGEMAFVLPLGTVSSTGDRLQFPVTLTYQAGIRVEQEATPAGLGFSVSAGGIVRKTVMIDDNTTDYYEHQSPGCEPQPFFQFLNVFLRVNTVIGSIALTFIPGLNPVGLMMMTTILPMLTNSFNDAALSMIPFGPQSFSAGGPHLPYYDFDEAKKHTDNNKGKGYFCGGSQYDYPDVYQIATPYINGEIVPVGDPSEGRFILKGGAGSPSGESAVKITYTQNTEEFVVTLSDGKKMFFGGEYCDLTSMVTQTKGHRNEGNYYCAGAHNEYVK